MTKQGLLQNCKDNLELESLSMYSKSWHQQIKEEK